MTNFEKIKQMSVEDMALMLMVLLNMILILIKRASATARSQTVIIALYTGSKARWKNDTE